MKMIPLMIVMIICATWTVKQSRNIKEVFVHLALSEIAIITPFLLH